MTRIEIARGRAAELTRLAEIAAASRADPERYVATIGDTADEVRAEIEGVDGWPALTHVARIDGRVAGWLLGEREPELGRVWWWGPFVADGAPWSAVADALYGAGRAALPAGFDEEELDADARSAGFAALAARHGFAADEASALLALDLRDAPVPDGRARPSTVADAGAVAALHDEIFPATHTPGRSLVASARGTLLVVADGDEIVGYVAADLHSEAPGHIDYVGVADRHRRRGVARELVVAALAALARQGAPTATLTVRVGNVAARRLYEQLGFVEERIVQPYRKGFTLP